MTHELKPKERFFRYFQEEVSALQKQIDKIADSSLVGGERIDAAEHCLAGIARLTNEVKNASPYLPAYDQRAYSEAIKTLSNRFEENRATFQPKTKFTFKNAMNARKNSSAVSPNEATKTASAQRLRTSDYHSDPPSAESSSVNSPGHVPSPPDEINSSESNPQGIIIRKPPISDAATVQVSNHTSAHIVLPSLASRTASSGSLTSLRRCVVDISASTASGMSFAGLALKDIRDSLIVCGNVNGPAHITEVKNSVIVVACRQFRMHDCKEVDVYLLCSSRPIIEDCHGIRFAPLPESYMPEPEQQIENQWDRVDDFKWLKVEHSPNWSVLPPEKRITPQFWGDVVRGGPDIALSNILKETILARQ